MKRKIAEFIVRHRIALPLLIAALSFVCIYTMRYTTINPDLSIYLADDTETKRGLQMMEGEFIPTSVMSVALIDVSETETFAHVNAISEMEGVLISSHNPDTGYKEHEGHEYRLISITMETAREDELLDKITGELAPDAYLISGAGAANRVLWDCLLQEIPVVVLVCFAIILLILTLTTTSYLEPLAFLVTIVFSILLNMGTNLMFDSISYITFGISSILQLALAMDYSVMLMHGYNRLRREGLEAGDAMIRTLANVFLPITSSALTTIAGMLALLFMSYTIGFDIGLVLTKGILFGLVTVFLFLPGLLILITPLMDKTRHKPLKFTGKWLMRIVNAGHGAIPILLILIIAASAYLQRYNVYSYNTREVSPDTLKIEEVFGLTNQVALIFPRDDSDAGMARQQELADRLGALTVDGHPLVTSTLSMVTTGKSAITYYDTASAAQLLGQSELIVQSAFNILKIEPPIRGDELLARLSDLFHVIDFLLPQEPVKQLAQARALLQTANIVFNSSHYSRMLINLDLSMKNPHNHEMLEKIGVILREVCGPDTGMAGSILAMDEITSAFSTDISRISAITIILVFLIVLVSFRSLVIPTMLVCMIQGAIWINMCFSSWVDGEIFFMCYLICIAMQMGATIDYGILLTSHYRSLRAEYLPKEAVTHSLALAMGTILTSSFALAVAGFATYFISTNYYISTIGLMLGRGAMISLLLVILLLPKLLLWLDRWVMRGLPVKNPADP